MRGLRKSRKLLGLLLGCLLLLTGCREVEDVIAPAQPESTPLLTVLVDQLPDSLDPLTATTTEGAALANYLCDGLLEFNADTGRPGPCLARSWDVSEDGLTLTLYLETGAAFADGAAVNAQAVVQNIQRWQSDGSDGLKEQLSAIQSVRASATSQVVLTLSQPDAGLFAVFCSPETGLVSPNVIQDGTAAQDPKGAGSYQLQNKQDWTIVLARREDYFRGTTPHQQVEFRVTSPAQAQEWMAQSDDYLAIGGLVSDITVNGSYQRYTATGLTSYQLYLNLQRLPLNTVRQLVGQTVQAKATVPSGFLEPGRTVAGCGVPGGLTGVFRQHQRHLGPVLFFLHDFDLSGRSRCHPTGPAGAAGPEHPVLFGGDSELGPKRLCPGREPGRVPSVPVWGNHPGLFRLAGSVHLLRHRPVPPAKRFHVQMGPVVD